MTPGTRVCYPDTPHVVGTVQASTDAYLTPRGFVHVRWTDGADATHPNAYSWSPADRLQEVTP